MGREDVLNVTVVPASISLVDATLGLFTRPTQTSLVVRCCCCLYVCRYGLVYAGVGWVLWREPDDVPEDLVFHLNYLIGLLYPISESLELFHNDCTLQSQLCPNHSYYDLCDPILAMSCM